jgi:peptidoglycan/LPS O-acetylase OafA/YrhL
METTRVRFAEEERVRGLSEPADSDPPPLAASASTNINGRVAALDGMRGVLAVVVLAGHVCTPFGITLLLLPSHVAVCMFFIMSGYVLTRSWDDKLATFLLRRFIRLWPVYAATLAVGFFIAGRYPQWTQFFWYPYVDPRDPSTINPQTWSLVLEAWAMPLMPFIVWAGASSAGRAALVMLLVLCAGFFYAPIFVLTFFIAGAFFSRKQVRNAWLESTIPQWLGKISYSLYLSHFLVLIVFVKMLGPWGGIICLPLVFLIGWLTWFAVERPSIWLSRRVSSFRARDWTGTSVSLS